MSLKRINSGTGHRYLLDGQKVPGATTLIKATRPAGGLINWAGDTPAAYAVDHWAELEELPPTKRLAKLKKSRNEERDAAARRGTQVHRLGEQLVYWEEPEVPEELAGHVDSYVKFLDTFDPKPVLVEAVLANRSVGYCGTLDLVADILGVRWLLDIKTARSGIWPETALQLVAYKRAEIYLDPDGYERSIAALGIERIEAVHVRSDGWELREILHEPEVWEVFRHLAWIYRHTAEEREWIGAPLEATA